MSDPGSAEEAGEPPPKRQKGEADRKRDPRPKRTARLATPYGNWASADDLADWDLEYRPETDSSSSGSEYDAELGRRDAEATETFSRWKGTTYLPEQFGHVFEDELVADINTSASPDELRATLDQHFGPGRSPATVTVMGFPTLLDQLDHLPVGSAVAMFTAQNPYERDLARKGLGPTLSVLLTLKWLLKRHQVDTVWFDVTTATIAEGSFQYGHEEIPSRDIRLSSICITAIVKYAELKGLRIVLVHALGHAACRAWGGRYGTTEPMTRGRQTSVPAGALFCGTAHPGCFSKVKNVQTAIALFAFSHLYSRFLASLAPPSSGIPLVPPALIHELLREVIASNSRLSPLGPTRAAQLVHQRKFDLPALPPSSLARLTITGSRAWMNTTPEERAQRDEEKAAKVRAKSNKYRKKSIYQAAAPTPEGGIPTSEHPLGSGVQLSASGKLYAPPSVKPFPCEVPGCGKGYTTASNLKLHVKDKHETPSSAVPSPTSNAPPAAASKKRLYCHSDACGKSFVRMRGLKKHYENSGAHGVVGLKMLEDKTHPPPSAPKPPAHSSKRAPTAHDPFGDNDGPNALYLPPSLAADSPRASGSNATFAGYGSLPLLPSAYTTLEPVYSPPSLAADSPRASGSNATFAGYGSLPLLPSASSSAFDASPLPLPPSAYTTLELVYSPPSLAADSPRASGSNATFAGYGSLPLLPSAYTTLEPVYSPPSLAADSPCPSGSNATFSPLNSVYLSPAASSSAFNASPLPLPPSAYTTLEPVYSPPSLAADSPRPSGSNATFSPLDSVYLSPAASSSAFDTSPRPLNSYPYVDSFPSSAYNIEYFLPTTSAVVANDGRLHSGLYGSMAPSKGGTGAGEDGQGLGRSRRG